MSRIASLISRLEENIRQTIELERERAAMMRELSAGATDGVIERPAPPKSKRSKCIVVSDQVKAVIKTMTDAGGQLRCREIAERLNISGTAASYRIRMAVRHGFVVANGQGGIYKVVDTVPP